MNTVLQCCCNIRSAKSCVKPDVHIVTLSVKQLKSRGCLMCLHDEKLQCLNGKVAICGARLLSVSRQVGAHL